jgi:hypothetical protein
MKRNTFHAGSFFIGLLIGVLFLAFVFYAYYSGRMSVPTAPAAATPTPELGSTQPAIPVTGDGETGNPIRIDLRSLFQQINQQIVIPLVAWFNRSVRINTNGVSTPVLVNPTPAP